jgi:gamma-tubulin complex component 5
MAGIYEELQKVVQYIETVSMIEHNASTISAAILNLLWASIQKRIALNDIKTADALLNVWRITGEPTWHNLNRWLKDGVPVYVSFEDHDEHPTQIPTWDQDEFFIRVNPLINSNSPEFWEAGYTLPHYDKDIAITDQRNARYPLFLRSFAQDILAAGKAVGLLRGIGVLNTTKKDWLRGWKTLREATAILSLQALDRTLSDALSQILWPPCEHVQGLLYNVLIKECQFWKYLHSVEYICLMNRGDALSIFCEKLFIRVCFFYLFIMNSIQMDV